MSSPSVAGAAAAAGRLGDPVRSILSALDEGRLVGAPLAATLRLAGLAWMGAGLMVLVQDAVVWPFIPGVGMAAGIAQSVIVAAGCVAVGLAFLHRARGIHAVGFAPFAVVPAISVLLRLAGEGLAILHLAAGLAGAIFTATTDGAPLFLAGSVLGGTLDWLLLDPDFLFVALPDLGGWSRAVRPTLSLLGSVAVGYAGLVVAYYLAEQNIVLVHIATRRPAESPTSRGAEVLAVVEAPDGEPPAVPARGPAAAVFCEWCGTPLAVPGAGCVACPKGKGVGP